MKRMTLLSTLFALAAFSVILASQTPSGHALFEQALAKERVEGNLPEAIKLYERVVAEFASDRTLAARALVQIGMSYEKLGRDEAVRAYERLVRDFADQDDAVELARVRLAILRQRDPSAATLATVPVVRPVRVPLTFVSPDGTQAMIIDFETGQNLAVYDERRQQTTRLTDFNWNRESFYAIPGAWSPGGRRIAYAQCGNQFGAGCELRTVTLGGGSDVIFRTEAGGSIRPAAWLTDGTLVVVFGRADRSFSIGFVPAAGGTFTQLRSLTAWTGPYPAMTPSVSRDERLIAFDDGGDIHVISRDGRTAQRITDHPADDHGASWSPDGRHLAFLSSRGGGVALWAVAMKGGQANGEPVRLKDGLEDALPWVSWTAQGFAYSLRERVDDSYTVAVDPATSAPVGSPRLIPYRRTGFNVVPEWSPDRRYLAFVTSSPAERDRRAVVVLPSGGGEPREFPFPNLTNISGIRWFGDSRGLGFTGLDARGGPTVFRLTLATGEWKTFPLPQQTRIEWNADGTRYFYSRDNSAGAAIVEHDTQSNRERVVFKGDPKTSDRFFSLRFSPDRRLLAMSHRRTDDVDRLGIVILDIETGRIPVVYDPTAGETVPVGLMAWSPAGRALLVGVRNPKTMDLRLIPIDGSEVRRLPVGLEITRLLTPVGGGASPSIEYLSWSPDGRQLAFGLRAQRMASYVIENPLALASAADTSARK